MAARESEMSWPWPAPEDDGRARHLVPGVPIPSVILPATTGAAVDLATVEGLCVVFVYPWTGSPGNDDPPGWDTIPGAHGSTPQAARFSYHYPSFRLLDAQVCGLSGQGSAHQQEFVARLGLPFPLLSDARREFQRALGLPTFSAGGVTYLKRLTLVLWYGTILHTFYPVHPPDRNADEVMARLLAG